MDYQRDVDYSRVPYCRKWYIINKSTIVQTLCFTALGVLGVNYLLYSFFRFEYNRNILRFLAGAFFLLSIVLEKKISFKEFCLMPIAAYMIVINGALSGNIAYFILAAIAIPYTANTVWKRLNFIQGLLTIVVIMCLISGVVNNRITSIGGRIRNTLGFTNVNAAAVFFFSFIIIWLLQLERVGIKHLVIMAAVSYGVYRLTDSRTVFACTVIFTVSYLFLQRWNGKWTIGALSSLITLYFLSPLWVIVSRSSFRQLAQLDLLLSYRMSKYYAYIVNHDIKAFLFGGSSLEGVDNFYLCLLYNGGILFYLFTWNMSRTALKQYIKNREFRYAAFILSITSYGLMESGVIRCELLCMIMFWYLILHNLKSGRREGNYVQGTV